MCEHRLTKNGVKLSLIQCKMFEMDQGGKLLDYATLSCGSRQGGLSYYKLMSVVTNEIDEQGSTISWVN